MTKQHKDRKQSDNERPLIPAQYQHATAIGILFLSLIVYFREPIFNGKVFLGADNIASHSFDTFMQDARDQGVFPLWNPYIFCGMPGYGSLTVTGDRWYDLSARALQTAHNAFGWLTTNLQVGNVLFYYVLLATGMYFLAFHKLRQKVPAFFVALATVYSTYIIIWIMTGHNTKIFSTSMFPFIFLLVELIREKFDWWKVLALTIAIHFVLVAAHVQITFYIFLAVGGYLLWYWIAALRKKEQWQAMLRTTLAFAGASVLAFFMDSDRYLSVLEYNPHSIRGSGPITETVQEAPRSTGGGLDYEYATNWSLGVGEVFTMVVPSLYGFGNVEYQGRLTNNQETRLPLYFGPQPFTDAPQYMGITVLVLAVIGFWRHRGDRFVQYLGIMILFSLLVAFGKEFPVVYDLMYRYFPTFNKFRVPSMILVLVQIMVPFLAGYGIVSFLSSRENHLSPDSEKKWKYLLGGLGGLFVVGLMGRGLYAGIYSSFFPRETVYQHYAQRLGVRNTQVLSELYDIVVNLVVTDIVVGLFLSLLVFGSFYLYLRHSMKLSTLAVVLSLAVVIDLWRVNTQPMDPRERSVQESVFSPTPVVAAILAQESSGDSTFVAPYRVLEFENGQPPLNNVLAYWRIQSAFGYQGAKMRRYQDLVDVVGLHHPTLWQIMNVKYIITNQPDTSRWLGLLHDGPDQKVYVNRLVLPRAFFVNRYEVADGLDVLRKIGSPDFDPRNVVYLAEDPGVQVQRPLPGTKAQFLHYGIQDFAVRMTTAGTHLLFLSESYYPEGWKARLNGTEIPVYRANYHFRAVVIPPGEHTLEMVFEPASFAVGKNLSLGTNLIVLSGLAFFGWRAWRARGS